MEFKIVGKFDNTYLKECLTLWRFSTKLTVSSIKLFAFCGLAYFGFAILFLLRGKSIPIVISVLGLTCFLILSIRLIDIAILKKRNKKNCLARIAKYANNQSARRELLFNEDAIKYADPNTQLELKWESFSHYQEYENYILFFLKESKHPTLSLNKQNIPEEISKDLIALINSKIPIKN